MAEKKRILIVGGVAGGASAATRARRMSETAEIIIFERGGEISSATCGFPYYIGGVIADRDHLFMQTPERIKKRYHLEVRTGTEVLKIARERKEILTRNLETGEEKTEHYDALILSPGAEPVRPEIPGIKSELVFTLRSAADTDRIKKFVDENKPAAAAVIGGGYIGLEMTEALVARQVKVTLLELSDQVMASLDPEMAEFLHQHLLAKGVNLRLKTSVKKLEPKDGRLKLLLSNGETMECDMVVLGIGVRPEVKLAKEAGLQIGETGGIAVNEEMRTSDPDIFAVGDAVEVAHLVGNFKALIPLAGPANRQARIAATNIFRPGSLTYKKTQGTAICKVFDLAAGGTGLNEKTLKRLKWPYEKIYIHAASHATYYPGSSPVRLKLLFDPKTGKIFGAQVVGAEGVDKRIDVLAVAIRAGLTVFDLEDLELCYAPPYGSAKDPVNYAGFAAANIIRGDMGVCHGEEILNLKPDQLILDVRTRFEVKAGAIPGSVSIPIDDLRSRLGELPKDKEILVHCASGLRSYLACRILSQNGFRCRNFSGGFTNYLAVTGNPPKI